MWARVSRRIHATGSSRSIYARTQPRLGCRRRTRSLQARTCASEDRRAQCVRGTAFPVRMPFLTTLKGMHVVECRSCAFLQSEATQARSASSTRCLMSTFACLGQCGNEQCALTFTRSQSLEAHVEEAVKLQASFEDLSSSSEASSDDEEGPGHNGGLGLDASARFLAALLDAEHLGPTQVGRLLKLLVPYMQDVIRLLCEQAHISTEQLGMRPPGDAPRGHHPAALSGQQNERGYLPVRPAPAPGQAWIPPTTQSAPTRTERGCGQEQRELLRDRHAG